MISRILSASGSHIPITETQTPPVLRQLRVGIQGYSLKLTDKVTHQPSAFRIRIVSAEMSVYG
jgi:hypothetical protein